MSKQLKYDHRGFLNDTLKTLGAFEIASIGIDHMYFGGKKIINVMANDKNSNTSFGIVKQIDAGVLNVGPEVFCRCNH